MTEKTPFRKHIVPGPRVCPRGVQNNGTVIYLKDLNVPAANLFGCYISSEARAVYKNGHYEWSTDNYTDMLKGLLKRLKELTPKINRCCGVKTIYIYEGEVSNVKLNDEQLKNSGTNHWDWDWGKVNYGDAQKERE